MKTTTTTKALINRTPSMRVWLPALLAFSLIGSVSAGTIVYSEGFDRTDAGAKPLGDADAWDATWLGFVQATDVSEGVNVSDHLNSVNIDVNDKQSFMGIGGGFAAGGDRGFLFLGRDATYKGIAFTNPDATNDINSHSAWGGNGGQADLLSSLSFKLRNESDTNTTTHFLLQVNDGGNTSWLVNTTGFTNDGGTNQANEWAQYTLNDPTAAGAWSTLDGFDLSNQGTQTFVGNLGTLGSATTLSSNMTIEGYGFWSESTAGANQTTRVDDFTVTAIPEPGTLVLLGISLGALALFRRRKA
ncbi:MAG: PEP-CTERM sorting domain-containing protein [Verrucomicrobia bacterium]|nr:PEP-CTERM sorting domain-containing protein [Verrucomicrobiota bacterium]